MRFLLYLDKVCVYQNHLYEVPSPFLEWKLACFLQPPTFKWSHQKRRVYMQKNGDTECCSGETSQSLQLEKMLVPYAHSKLARTTKIPRTSPIQDINPNNLRILTLR